MADLKQLFSERLTDKRNEMGLSQQKLADMLGVSKSAIYSYESGNNYPSVKVLILLSEITGYSVEYLLGLSDTKVPNMDLEKPIAKKNGRTIKSADICNDIHSMPNEDILKILDYIDTIKAARAGKRTS